jgi:outer membrane protein TolC
MNNLRNHLALLLCVVLGVPASAQQGKQIAPEKPTGDIFVRPYEVPYIPPAPLRNSSRIRDLIRGGKLYLTVQDAVALALENNVDIESARYSPLLGQWEFERSQAGGPLPGVPSGVSVAGSVASGEGVAGSQAAAGVSTSGSSNNGRNSVNATITQIGPVTPTLDPVVQSVESYAHKSAPQPNLVQSGTINLIQNTRNYTETISKGLITGGTVSLSYSDSYLNENAPTDLLNPENGTVLSISFRHNLLQGFGMAVNSRTIAISKLNVNISDLNFKTTVMQTVVDVLDLYYGLAADYEDLKAKKVAVDVAQRFYADNQKQVQIGTMAPLDVITAEAQVASSQEALVASQATLEEQQLQLKDALSRNGLGDPLLAESEIIPLDRIEVPEKVNVPPMKELVATAVANRPDLEAAKLNLVNLQSTAIGTANGVLPNLSVLANAQTQGLNGTARVVRLRPQGLQTSTSVIPPGFIACPASVGPSGSICEVPDPYFVGGIGTALGQMIRRDFPSENVGGFIAPTLRNRTAQADASVDQLTLRQTQLVYQRSINQLAVDVSNQVIALQQAHVRYLAAVKNRVLEEQLLSAEQKKFSLGASTTYNVVQQQRDLATAQSSEVAALVAYSQAQIALDQTLGTTLRTNKVSIEEARSGQVARPSTLPAQLPEQR